MTDRNQVVVCDNGTGYVKCGFAGDAFPKEFPCVVGRPSKLRKALEENLPPSSSKDASASLLVGDQVLNRSHLRVTYPISNGIVQSWEDMTKVWSYTFQNVLNTDTNGRRIMLTDPPQNPKANRERMLETMFEYFNFGTAFIQVQAVLTLYSQGLLTGLVVDAGDGVTHAVPVIDGFSSPHLTRRLNIAGRHITKYLVELLQRRGYALNPASDLEVAAAIKEKLCYVAHDYAAEKKLAQETTCRSETYTLPDGRKIRIGAERFTAPEVLFAPRLIDVESPGVAEMVHECIRSCDIDNRLLLYNHIVTSGGTTMFAGFASRLEKDLQELYLKKVLQGDAAGLKKLKMRVEDPPRRKHMVFLGAAVLADIMKDRDAFWVRKQEWIEDPYRALKKCGTSF